MIQSHRILVVDDDSTARAVAVLILQKAGFDTIVEASCADDAYDLLEIENDFPGATPNVSLILLDICMPGSDGIEVCARARLTRRYRDTPILGMSGLGNTDSLRQLFLAGAHDFIAKPLNTLDLIARVNAALRFKREIDRRLAREAELQALLAGKLPPAGASESLHGRLAALIAQEAGAAGQPDQVLALILRELVSACDAGDPRSVALARSVAKELTDLSAIVPAPLAAAPSPLETNP